MITFETILEKLRIFDKDTHDLSLTSILLMVAIGRLAFFSADIYTTAILTLAITHSNVKKYSAHQKAKADTQATLKQAEIEASLKATEATATDKIDRIEAEVLKLIQAANISKLGR